MKTKNLYILILILIFIIQNTIAQNFPFEAKLMVRYPLTGKTDTVWFGCDTNATNNFDIGLDSLQTTFNDTIGILAHDTNTEAQFNTGSCGNLKRIIKPFSNDVYFDFYIKVDSGLDISTVYPQIFWDTLDFMKNGEIFQNDSFKITVVRLNVKQGGYLGNIDNEEPTYIYTTTHQGDCIASNKYFNEEVETGIIYEQPLFECLNNAYIIKINIYILFNWICIPVDIKSRNDEKILIYPNPNTGKFLIKDSKLKGELKIFNTVGVEVYQQENNSSISEEIDISHLPNGIYYLMIQDNKHNIVHKIIKQ